MALPPRSPVVHYYVHGRGRGHATRALAVLGALAQAGVRARVFAGDDALDVLGAAAGFDVVPTQSVPPRLGPANAAAVAALIARRTAAAVRALTRERPTAVISDSDLPPLLAARVAGVAAIGVGHGLAFAVCERPPGLPRDRWAREARKSRVSMPWADTFIAVNFTALRPRRAGVVVARPMVAADVRAAAALPRPSAGPVVAYFRDGNGEALLRGLVERGIRPVVFGGPQRPLPGVEVRPFDRASFVAALHAAPWVIGSAGSQLIGECLALRRPLVALHRDDDDEQALNVAMLRAADLGEGASLTPAAPTAALDAVDRWLRRQLAGPAFADPGAWDAPDVGEAVCTALAAGPAPRDRARR